MNRKVETIIVDRTVETKQATIDIRYILDIKIYKRSGWDTCGILFDCNSLAWLIQ